MIRGPISIYSGRTFLGRARVDQPRSSGEPIELSLGVENQIQIKRYKKEEKLEGSGVFGSKKKLHHKYEIIVGNWTRSKKTVTVVENIPVARVREIKVWTTQDTTKPTKVSKEDGIVRWTVTLSPRSQTTIKIGYTISLPKSYVVHGY